MKSFFITLAYLVLPVSTALAQDADTLPACAQTGASTVFFNGKPALKMSDVVNCPPELVEIVPDITIEGEPMVRLRSGTGEKARCTAQGSADIEVRGKPAQASGDADCVALD